MEKSLQRALVGACLFVLAACASVKDLGIPWISQGPGKSPEEAKSQREARPGSGGVESGASTARTTPPPAAQVRKPEVAAAAPAPVTVRSEPPASAREVVTAGSSYPQATRYGDLLFISGQIPVDLRSLEGNMDAKIDEQTRVAMENLRSVLEANRLTMANVVSTTVYLKNINDFPAADAVYARYFKGTLPARSVVEVSRLPRGALIEISAIAGR